MLPCSETVAILVTVRVSDHKNASCSCSGSGSAGGAAGEQPLDRGLAGLGVHPAVVDGLDPGGEQPVQLGEVSRRAGWASTSTRNWTRTVAKNRSILPRPSGRPGPAVHEGDAEHSRRRAAAGGTTMAQPLSK